jgi:hypothetical protein
MLRRLPSPWLRAIQLSGVLAGLDPAIHVCAPENVDALVKHEHDDLELNCVAPWPIASFDALAKARRVGYPQTAF